MKDSIYVLSKDRITVENLHLFTWDVRSHPTYVEVGLSIANEDTLPAHVVLYLVLPFLNSRCKVTSLHVLLNDPDNYKFIFNEIPDDIHTIGAAKQNGCIVTLSGTDSLRNRIHHLAKATTTIHDTLPIVKVEFDRYSKPDHPVGHFYVRLLVKTQVDTIAEVIRGIAKRSYIFDVKINESRNIPAPCWSSRVANS